MPKGSFRRRRLARELRRLREQRDLTGEAVANALHVSPSTISRIETASVEILPKNVRMLLDHYGVTGEPADALLTLAREAKRRGWWHAYGDVLPDWFEGYVDLESEAETLQVYDSQFVNGLLQTPGYARALLTISRPEDPPRDIERRVELRMQRHTRLSEGGLKLRLVLDECVLHHYYGGPAVMSAQLVQLTELAQLPNVSLQILPARSASGVVGSFSVAAFPESTEPAVVYLENEVGALYLEKAEQVRQYSQLYERLEACALSPEASLAHLVTLLREER